MFASVFSVASGLLATVIRAVPLTGLLFSPLSTVVKFVFNLAANPLGRVVLIAALVVGGYMLGDVRGRIADHKRCEAKITELNTQAKKEAADAVAKAEAASRAAQQNFDHGRDNNRPGLLPRRVRHGSDGFSRD